MPVDVTAVGEQVSAPLGSAPSLDPGVAGAKAASLADLIAGGFDVPAGVVITTIAWSPLDDGPGRPTAEVRQALEAAIAELGNGPLAVRSSGVTEDLAGASFAGQYETVLGVFGVTQLEAAVQRCWASALSPNVTAYRRHQGVDTPPAMAVLVQRQLEATAAGVAFSADPVTGDGGVTVVNAVAGIGDRLVSGEVTPEVWRADRNDPEPQRVPGGPAVLSPSQAAAVVELARGVAARRGSPQDVEWALEGGRLWVLQARPVTAAGAAGGVVPVPVPVDPPEGFWERDPSHFPDPVSPLQRSLLYDHARRHTPSLMREFGMLADGIDLRDIGGWHYIRIVPLGGKDAKPPPMWMSWLMARLYPPLRRRLRAARRAYREDRAGQLVDRWYREWMPHLERRIQELASVDLPALSDQELSAHLDAAVALKDDGIGVHVLVIGAHMVGVYGLARSCAELLGWDDAKALDMLAGLSARSTEPSRQLGELTRSARDRPAVRELLASVPADDAVERLADADSEFGAAFERYRSRYGHRPVRRDVDSPTLAERPGLLLQLIANQLATGYDAGGVAEENRRLRDATVAQARQALASHPAADRNRFETALRQAERAYPIREDNVFFTHCAPDGLTRYTALEMGRRMAARGQLHEVDDVFFLEHAELVGRFRDGADARSLVDRRRGERAWVLSHPGPAHFGAPPADPPSLGFLPAKARYTMEALLWNDLLDGGRSHRGSEGRRIQGVPASVGLYSGPARVILGEHDFGKIRAGDVVVCPTTSPTWSVLFPSMGALVADSGGILNHPAIIAREYRIPAVVATGNATTLIRDGMVVTVDGASGVVEILDGRDVYER